MRKITLLIASLFITMSAMAQVYQQTGTIYTAAELNAMTQEIYIAVKNVSGTNSYYLAADENVASFSNDVVLVWEPVEEGVAGTYNLRRLSAGDNGYIQATTGSNVAITLGAKSTAQAFEAVETAALTESGFNSAGSLVRFKQYGASTWLNCNTSSDAPRLGNTGTGGWTMHNVYAVELVQAVSVTYRYLLGEEVKKELTVEQAVGSAYALPVDFPYVTETIEDGTVTEATTVDVTCELQDMPFVAAESFAELADIEHWYYVKLHSSSYYCLHYDEGQEYIDLGSTAVDEANKDIYTWAFVGDPFDGYKIINYAAGAEMILSSSTTMAGTQGGGTYPVMTAVPVADGNNELWIATASSYATNGFFLAQKDYASNVMNARDGKLAYWTGGADGGSTFVVEERPMGASAELLALVEEAEALLAQIEIGEGVGKYSSSYENYETDYTEIVAYSQNIPATATDEEIEAKTTTLQAIIASFSLNMPEAGKYYTFQNDDYYITSGVTDAGKIALNTTKDATAIYYYDGQSLLAYTTGLYFGLNSSDWTFEAVGSTEISEITFIAAANGVAAKYNIYSENRWLHRTDAYINRCSNNTCGDNHNWMIEEVTELPVTVTDAGYATLFAPVALAVPADVTAYTVSINEGGWADLNEITNDVIPAEVGVVLTAAAGTYNFAVTTTTETAETALSGSAATTYYTTAGTYYALAQVDGVVGFYKDEFNNSRFQNNSHKAYLYVAGEQAENTASYSFRFGEGTTGIDEITDNRVQSTEIYDLTGRRVENITAPSIYIVNGVKRIVK